MIRWKNARTPLPCSRRARHRASVGFYRLSVPIAGIALALLAIPLAYVNPRLGRSINLIIAILLLMISLNVMNIIQAQIDQQRIGLIAALLVFHLSLAAIVAGVFYYRYRGAVFIWRSRTQTTTTDHGSAA